MCFVLTLPSVSSAAWWRPALGSKTHSEAEILQGFSSQSEVSADGHAAPGSPNTQRHTHSLHFIELT